MSVNQVSNAFQMQYASLILILLTFLVGALAAPKMRVADKAEMQVQRVIEIEPESFANLDFSALWSGLNQLNQDKAWALAQVLKSHDLNAQIEILAANDLALALTRSMKLSQYLLAEGVPDYAFRVITVAKHSAPAQSAEVAINFSRSIGDN